MAILIGCSGWSYDDWVGRFYPMALAKKKGAWLAYYAKYFRTVEINSTFYRPPGELQVSSWIKKGHDLSDFEYSLKMPELVTHKSMVQGDASAAVHWAKAFEKTCVQPLGEAGLLGCVLLQLSPYFQNTAGAQRILETVLDALSFRDYNYAVEFRHRTWQEAGTEEIDPWVPRIKEAELKARAVRVYFNNHARSKSVRNAFQLMDQLMLPHESREIRLQNQFTLGNF